MEVLRQMPLNDSQMGIYLECVNRETALQYNISFEYTFSVDTDAARLAAACEAVLKNYAAFSSVVLLSEGQPVLARPREMSLSVPVSAASEAEYAQRRAAFVKPFALDGSPLCRLQVFKTETAVYLLMDIHHLIYDGVSTQIFESALSRAYLGKELPAETVSIYDAAVPEQAEKQGPQYARALEYFNSLLDGVEVDSNPLPDVFGEETNRCAMLHYDMALSRSALAAFAKARGVSENVVLLSAFTYALCKYTGREEALFSTINSGRRGKPLENTVGFFVRTFPLYFKPDEELSVSDYIDYIRQSYFATMRCDAVPFSVLAEQYGVRSDVKYIYQGDILSDFTLDGRPVTKTLLDCEDALSNLDVMVTPTADSYRLRLDYRTDLYSGQNILGLARLFEQIARELPGAARLRDINLLSAADAELLNRLNATEQPYDQAQTVWDVLRDRVASQGESTAVVFRDKTLSYRMLDRLTGALAAYISGRGLGRGDFVAVLIPRNEYMAVTAWGVVRAGAAYQPLDPAYPPERLSFLLKDSGAKLLIADRALLSLVKDYNGPVLFTDEIEALAADAPLAPRDTPEAPLVVIYTSGTTGTPKGCILENRNILCFYHNHARVMGLDNASRVATYASFGFDAGIMDIFTTLMAGAALYIIPDELRLDILKIDDFYNTHGITHGFITTQVGRMFAEITTCATLRALLVGGEKLVPFRPPQGFAFLNGYGPSETLAYVCHHRVTDASLLQPVGLPSGNTKLYVTDRFMRLLPPGACGELCVAGGQVGRGYHNRPEKNAECFVSNPFTTDAYYSRLYKTGDVVRLLPELGVDFVGRRDAQIKIRGFRVELTEIEQVIRAFPGIKDASVQAFDAPGGGKLIAAYTVSDTPVDIAALNAFILETKPEYMVPEITLQLPQIPLNANGKVDKRALPVPQHTQKEILLPQNEIQQRIWSRAAEVLGHQGFGIDTGLFTVGLSSLGVIRLNVLLAEEFGVSFTIKDLRRFDTVQKLEQHISALSDASAETVVPDYPLTKTQEGIYIECLSRPDSLTYNIPLFLRLDASLSLPRLKQALAEAVNAHGYLQTRLFTAADGTVRQKNGAAGPFVPQSIELLTAATPREALKVLLKPYTLLNAPLFRLALVRADSLYLYFDVHHIIGDGASVNIFLRDVERAYRGESLPPESFTGYDVARAEEKARQGGELTLAQAHFDALFAAVDPDFAPAPDRHPAAARDSGALELTSAPDLAPAVEAYCRNNNLSVNGLMLSAFGLVLAKFNAEDYSVFTTVYNGRNDSRTENTFAMLVKTLPVYVPVGEQAPRELAAAVSDQFIDSMVNDVFSFAEISRAYGIRTDVMFIYQGSEFGFNSFCGRPSEELSVSTEDKKAPLSLQVFVKDGAYLYRADYDNERYTEGLVRSLIRALDCALRGFIRCESLREISLLDEEDLRALDSFNATETPMDESKTIAGWFEEIAARYPQNTAVVCENRRYTYAQIEALSASLAQCIQKKGYGRGDFIAVLVNRNEYMPIGALGALRAGAAYEPLDPAYPPERLKFMLEDAAVRLVVADRELSPLLAEIQPGAEIIYTDEIAELPAAEGLRSPAEPEDLFVIVYTSGTTGKPKGNRLAHRHPVSLFSYHLKDAQLGPDCKTAYYTGFSFDAGLLDLYAPLLSGGTLCIVTEELRLDLAALDRYFCEQEITHSCMTTQMGSLFVAMTSCSTLRYFMVGGEKLVPFIPPAGLRFVNGYGPSECTVYSSRYDVTDDSLFQPIGKPIDNLKYYIVDKYNHRLPLGAAGELCIAGKQVGLGYLNRPEKNAEAFETNPFTDEPGYTRLYHTGDVVRELTDGNYDFVGRKDGQVKIRGFRVELTEIEQVIRRFEGIDNATVQAFDDPAGGKYVAAYLVSASPVDTAALSRFIGQSKPSYMIPAAYVQLDAIPLTANGKVDKRALPKPEKTTRHTGAEPSNAAEKAFCDIFREVLGLDKVYADDDFFSIGGSSITAAQAVVKCDAAGYSIVFKNFFENPTPQKLARFVTGAGGGDILAPGGEEREKYDYSCLAYNVPQNLPNIKFLGLGDVLLTGVTGYLGAHVYRALMEKTEGRVICLVRAKNGMTAEDRFRMIMTYYFEDWLCDAFTSRTVLVDGDLADENIHQRLEGLSFDTILNNAANVKHFDRGDNLVKDNFESVEHLISLAERSGARLVQASSLSVCGESVNGSIPTDFRFKEFNLNIGQSLENKYVYSKYMAEQAIVDAISRKRIRGKIIRLGNLAARNSDGEYQINASNSGLLKLMQGYIKLGCYPVDMLDAGIEFSPIDKVAEAMVLLAGTPEEFTVFHAKNCHEIHYGYFIHALREKGYPIDIVEHEEFERRFKTALETERDLTDFTGFIAYLNRADESVTDVMVYNDDEANSAAAVGEQQYETRVKVSSDTSFTTKALYRLGFAWPITNEAYLESMIDMLDDKAFFDKK